MAGGRIVIAGAGSIGGFVGALLAAAGRQVTLLTRPRIAVDLAEHGVRLSSFEGWTDRLEPGRLRVETEPAAALADATLVLVTVKSGDTAAMARLIAQHAPPSATIVSLQNGLGNAAVLRDALPGRRVLAGMVPFNVVQLGQGRFHRGTSGDILIDPAPDVVAALDVPRLGVAEHDDMRAVLAGKLLLNLNNALNALAGVPLHVELGQRDWRRLLADCQAEALRMFAALGIRPWSLGPLPARWLPRVLRLPTPLFRLAMRASVRIDRSARSSMWEDLERRRPTEIDELQGWVTRTAASARLSAPVNAAIAAAVRDAEAAGNGSPRLSPKSLREAIKRRAS